MNFHSVVCSSGVVVVLIIYARVYISEASTNRYWKRVSLHTVQCTFYQCMLHESVMCGWTCEFLLRRFSVSVREWWLVRCASQCHNHLSHRDFIPSLDLRLPRKTKD